VDNTGASIGDDKLLQAPDNERSQSIFQPLLTKQWLLREKSGPTTWNNPGDVNLKDLRDRAIEDKERPSVHNNYMYLTCKLTERITLQQPVDQIPTTIADK
jgi:hypothetical protein